MAKITVNGYTQYGKLVLDKMAADKGVGWTFHGILGRAPFIDSFYKLFLRNPAGKWYCFEDSRGALLTRDVSYGPFKLYGPQGGAPYVMGEATAFPTDAKWKHGYPARQAKLNDVCLALVALHSQNTTVIEVK
jgi:hypothetical protein